MSRAAKPLATGELVRVRPQRADRLGMPHVIIRGGEAVVVRVVDADLVVVDLVGAGDDRLPAGKRRVVPPALIATHRNQRKARRALATRKLQRRKARGGE